MKVTETVDCCLLRKEIPLELRNTIQSYLFINKPMNDETIHHAILLWCQNQIEGMLMYGPINEWNTSLVTHMAGLFYQKKTFNDCIDQWDVSNVKIMLHMFCGAYAFNQPLHTWDVRQVADMRGMFQMAISFNQSLHTVKRY